MIRIRAIARHGAAAPPGLSAEFGSTGGTIGRSPSSTLMLDDPDRTVSRVHAQVLCRNGQFFIVDRGSNALLCDGRALGAGNEAALQDGDRLVIGGFELVVELLAGAPAPAATPSSPAASDDDPFADLLAGLSLAAVPAPACAAAAPSRDADASADAASLLFPDPMQTHTAAAKADEADPFADLLGPGPGGAHVANIDDLFGGKNASQGLGGDPLAMSPLADPMLQPNTAGAGDPFAALQRQAAPVAAPRSDHVPVGQFGYVPPVAQNARAALSPVTTPAPGPALREAAPDEQFDDMTGLPIRIAGPARAKPLASPRLPPAAAAVAPAPAAARPASGDDLLAAFLRGLGSQHQPPDALTPALMERIGAMLRASTEGTLQLLLTRQEFKREVRAEVTVIASQANNPLKFSPTVEVALAHLLGPGVRGFMPADAAMRDAFNDLRAHQFGVMVGMRAALAHVIARFEPAELETKIAAKSAFDSLFAAGRKARLWDQFVALYAGIATEAEDDFHSLFGKAFVAAYEEQMAHLQTSESSGPAGH